MTKKRHIKIIAGAVVLAMGILASPWQLWGQSSNIVAETTGVAKLTVSQVQDLAEIYNPTNKTLSLNLKTLTLSQQTTANNLRSTQNSINSGSVTYDSSGSASIQSAIDTLRGQDPEGSDAAIQAQISALQVQLASAQASESSAYSQRLSSIESAISSAHSINATLDDLDDQQDDLEKQQADWKTQVRMIAQLLCLNLTQQEKNIEILESQIEIAEKSLQLSQVQQALGMALTTDISDAEASLLEARQSLTAAQESLDNIKRQINLLIGREQDHPLEIEAASLPVAVQAAPAYTDELLKAFTKVNYELQTLYRTKNNYRSTDTNGYGSDQLQELDYQIQSAQLSIEEKERSIADDLKALLATINSDKSAYEKSQLALTTAQQNYHFAQTKYELGMLTELELLSAALNLKSAELTNIQNGYRCLLDWQEYNALRQGVDLSTYQSYRM